MRGTLETPRLVLRPWRESDAPSLFEYARDERIGPSAGWPVHAGEDESLRVIREVLSAEEIYAVVPREVNCPVGSIGLLPPQKSSLALTDGEAELGYWIGVPFWGRGLIPEAAEAVLTHAFSSLGMHTVWCGYYEGNEKSRRVGQKCGFQCHHIERDKPCPLLGELRTEYVTRLTREEWLARQSKKKEEKTP